MNWLAEFVDWIKEYILFGPLEYLRWGPNTIFIILIMFGLAYWTFYWQPKYNKESEANADQLN